MELNNKVPYEKFIETNEINDYEVLTPEGWINIEGIGKTILFNEYVLITESGRKLICADNHILGRCDNIDYLAKNYDMSEIYCKDLNIGDFVMTINGPEQIIQLDHTEEKSHMYDLQISQGSDKHYYTNGFVSHNSCWAQNFCVNMADQGYNVLYITLELSEKKALKRMGSMRLGIPISQYSETAKDREFMKERIRECNSKCTAGLFDKEPGKIWIKEYPSGFATINEIENSVKLIQEMTGKTIDFLAVDYIQIMRPIPSLQIDNMLYLKGKHLAEGLRSIASRYNLACLTMTQIAKEKYDANDIMLNDIPESKAIADTSDSVFAIIRTPIMKIESSYQLKQLKLRDSNCEYERIRFDMNKQTLKIHNDSFIENVL